MNKLLAMVVLLGVPAVGQQNASVEGVVRDRATQSPVREVQLVLRPADNHTARPIVTYSDSEGRFRLTGLAPQRYTLGAEKSGYVPRSAGDSTASAVTLSDGEALEGFTLWLEPAAVIAGRVTDELGDPMSFVNIKLLRVDYRSGSQRLVTGAEGQTDDRGEYRLYNIPPGDYYLRAFPPPFFRLGGRALGYAPQYLPGVRSLSEARSIRLASGEERLGANFRLAAYTGAMVSGHVLPGEGPPPMGANEIEVTPAEGGPSASWYAPAGENGAFRMGPFPPGDYVIWTIHSDRDSNTYSDYREFSIADADVDGIDLRLRLGVALPIHARWLSDAGSRSPAGIQLTVEETHGALQQTWTARLNGKGEATIQSLPRGEYRISIELISTDVYIVSMSRADVDLLSQSTTVSDDDSTPVEIVLGPDGGRLSGQTASGAVVALLPESPEANQYRFHRITADQEGRYEIAGIAPGAYLVVALAALDQGGEFDPRFRREYHDHLRRVELKAGDTVTLDLPVTPEAQL